MKNRVEVVTEKPTKILGTPFRRCTDLVLSGTNDVVFHLFGRNKIIKLNKPIDLQYLDNLHRNIIYI